MSDITLHLDDAHADMLAYVATWHDMHDMTEVVSHMLEDYASRDPWWPVAKRRVEGMWAELEADIVRRKNAYDELVAEVRATRDELKDEHDGGAKRIGGHCRLCARCAHIADLLAKLEDDDA